MDSVSGPMGMYALKIGTIRRLQSGFDLSADADVPSALTPLPRSSPAWRGVFICPVAKTASLFEVAGTLCLGPHKDQDPSFQPLQVI